MKPTLGGEPAARASHLPGDRIEVPGRELVHREVPGSGVSGIAIPIAHDMRHHTR